MWIVLWVRVVSCSLWLVVIRGVVVLCLRVRFRWVSGAMRIWLMVSCFFVRRVCVSGLVVRASVRMTLIVVTRCLSASRSSRSSVRVILILFFYFVLVRFARSMLGVLVLLIFVLFLEMVRRVKLLSGSIFVWWFWLM